MSILIKSHRAEHLPYIYLVLKPACPFSWSESTVKTVFYLLSEAMICAIGDHASSTRKSQITVVMISHCVSTKKLANEFAISVMLRSQDDQLNEQ